MCATSGNTDELYNLHGTCKGCRRVTWLCRRDRRCSKYATTPKRGHVATPTGYTLSPDAEARRDGVTAEGAKG
jgi:hypothetical protein